MAKFLTFETTAIKLNDSIFPSNTATFGLQASTTPVFDINGNLIDYAPNGPIQGKFSTEFFLTGALPDYLKFDNQSDVPISVSFNNFNIPSAFLTDLSFSVEPYQPISVNVSFDFYHGILSLDTNLNDIHNLFSPADGTNQVKNKLATLNGLSSYIITNDRSTYAQNPDDFIVSNFNYSFSVDRQPLLRVKQSIPSRVALRQVNGQFGVTANNIDGLLDIHGNDAIFNAILKDSQNPNVYTAIGLTGIITDQNYVISDSSYGVGTVKMIQNITKKRNIISIPFGNDAPEILEVLPPVTKIFVPEVPRIPTIPIPPPPPPPKIIIPTTPVEPPAQLDTDLIWFDVYARLYDLNPLCASSPYSIRSNVSQSFNNQINQNDYRITFKNHKEAIPVSDDEDSTDIINYFICSIGVTKAVLNADLQTCKSFNFIENIDSCSLVDYSITNDNNKLAISISFTPYEKIDGVCKPQYKNNNLLCQMKYCYATWAGLISEMNSVYDNDPSKNQTLILSLQTTTYLI